MKIESSIFTHNKLVSVNFSPMSPKLLLTHPHREADRGINLAQLFLWLVLLKLFSNQLKAFNIHVLNETIILWSPHLLGSSDFWDISWFKQFEFNRIILKDFEIMSPFNPHSWAKFKIALVRKLGRKFYYRHSSFKVVFMPGKNRVKGKPC